MYRLRCLLLIVVSFCCCCPTLFADQPQTPDAKKLEEILSGIADAKLKGDSAWMMISTALVMLMIPGLALFYGGMVRRKNLLSTMMQSMAPLAIVGVVWVVCGYSLSFGHSWAGMIGWSSDLFCLQGIKPDTLLPGSNIPVFLHVLFQGMFAIITPALISGAIAERIRFVPYCVFVIIWSLLVYTPLAHAVWAMDWFGSASGALGSGSNYVGWLGAKPPTGFGALDFAGGTVVHIAAGLAGLAAALALPKRRGNLTMPTENLHLTLLGAGILWFGWFGFNAGSATSSGTAASSAFLATQVAAASAALVWMLFEYMHKRKVSSLGFASGLVAGLVAITPAAGFVSPAAALAIGGIGSGVCFFAVQLKNLLRYDDTLDAFGIHGVGGMVGALLTGVFWSKTFADPANASGLNGLLAGGGWSQLLAQAYAVGVAGVYSFAVTYVLIKLIDKFGGLHTPEVEETQGLDQSQHDEGQSAGEVTTASLKQYRIVVQPNEYKEIPSPMETRISQEAVKTEASTTTVGSKS